MLPPLSLKRSSPEKSSEVRPNVDRFCDHVGFISLFGFIRFPDGLLILPLRVLGGIPLDRSACSSQPLLTTSKSSTCRYFYSSPYVFFSGTFFPIENLPRWAQQIALLFPLTHLVNLARSFSFGKFSPSLLWEISYLLNFQSIFFPLALSRCSSA